jgi:hypothetical protein
MHTSKVIPTLLAELVGLAAAVELVPLVDLLVVLLLLGDSPPDFPRDPP